jgi:hypothetical protein
LPSYVKDPNDSKKRIPGPLPDNAYDRAIEVLNISESLARGDGIGESTKSTKSPNSVFITQNNGIPPTGNMGFYFGTSASFAKLDLKLSGTGFITCSKGSDQISGSTGKTSFDTELVNGDRIEIISESVSQILTVENVSSSISMSLTSNYTLENGGAEDRHMTSSKIVRRRSFMSQNYTNYGSKTGSLDIHPIAYSGSNGDKVIFIYNSGLTGSPKKPFGG